MSRRVLVVEDHADLADILRELFEAAGARVHVAPTAREAERAARAEPFELAVIDVALESPVDGLALVPRLRALATDGEIILVSGNATLESAIEAVRHGIFAYLRKPFDPTDLISLGERALSQVALRRERAALSKELARSEILHRAVFDAVDSLIVGLDKDHRVRLWNPWAERVTGWSCEEVVGQDACALLLPEEQRAPFHRALEAAREGAWREVTVLIRPREGAEREVVWHLQPMSPEGSTSTMVLMTGTDVTEKRALERRAAEAEAMAAMGRLTSSLAHEIRNPLNAAKLQLELLRRAAKKLPDGEIRQTLAKRADVVGAEIDRLSKLLDDFMGLARPRHLAMEPFDVRALLEEIAATQRPAALDAGATLEVDAGEDTPPGYGDAGRLRQALVNLVANSIEAICEHGGTRIALSARSDGERVALRVEDDGPGLDKSGHEVIRPFVTTKKAGTGLGLPIVKNIAELHGGALEIAPREGGGTVATLSVRRGDRETSAREASAGGEMEREP